MKWLPAMAVAAILALLPATALAQRANGGDDNDVLIRINGPVNVARGDTANTVVVVSDDAVIDGTVLNNLVVINGTATVNGTVDENVVVLKGTLNLGPTAHVVKDVTLFRGDLNRDPGAVVDGTVRHRNSLGLGAKFLWLLRLSMTVLVLVCGVLFAAVGGRQLAGSVRMMTGRTGQSVLTAVIVWVVLPIIAILAFITVIGIPLGLSVFIFLMPALWFVGYLVAGTVIGALILRATGRPDEGDHPYLAAVAGLIVLQIVTFLPFIGGLVLALAGVLGAGALIYRSWSVLRGEAGQAPPPPPMMPATP
jgi:hypothetical protein